MRQITITPGTARPSEVRIALIRDEPLRILMADGAALSFVFTLSASEGGAPLVEIPASAGQIDLLPAVMQPLTEGAFYHWNIWQGASPARQLVAKGQIFVSPSIVPTGADFATMMLNNFGQQDGVQRVVVLTQAQYDALAAPDPDVLYFRLEAA